MKTLCNFTCECTLQRNGVEVPLKSNKSKTKTFRLLSYQDPSQALTESNFEVAILVGNSDEVLYKTKCDKIKKLHSAFIQEGRITLEVAEDAPTSAHKNHLPSDVSLKENFKVEKTLMIMIKGTQAEILKNFCRHLADIKKKKDPSSTGMDIENKAEGLSQGLRGSQNSNSKPPTPISQTPKTPSTPVFNRMDSSSYKVNRNALNSIYKEQTPSSQLKRRFDSVKKEGGVTSEIELSQKKFRLTIKNPFKLLPDAVIIHIMKFLTPKEYINQKLVSKNFYQVISNAKTRLDFRGKGDIPHQIIIKYLNSCHNLEKIFLGQSKHLIQKHFLEDIKCEFTNLRLIDFSSYMNLTDKAIMKFYRTCKTLETIKLGYYSGITDAAIDTIPSFLENVTGLYLKCSNKLNHTRKDKITDTCLAKFLKRYDRLQHFSIYLVGPIFLYKAFESTLINLKTLKIDHLILNKSADLILLENLSKCENLEFLKIGNIIVENAGAVLTSNDAEVFQHFLSRMPNLRSIKFGDFAKIGRAHV